MKFQTKTDDGLEWGIVYDKAIREDGSLFFPQKLTQQFLKTVRRTQGSYIFANQYQNEIIPEGDQDFKKSWLRYYDGRDIKGTNRFAFIDPAISLEDTADFTALVIVDVDVENNWYLKVARAARITATQTVQLIFTVLETFKPLVIGVEIVAYQRALMHFVQEEARRRQMVVPIEGINRGPEISKDTRIRSLVPRFEWDRIQVAKGLDDFEDQYSKFPRGKKDILDALQSIDEISYPPVKPKRRSHVPHPTSPEYEKWYIQNKLKG